MPSHRARLSTNGFIGSLIAVAMVCAANHAAAQDQSCKQTIEYLDSAKVAQTSYDQEQKQVQARIEEIDKGTEALRQKLSTQQCRPSGAAADDAKQQLPTCDAMLKVILDAQKARTALEAQVADLRKKTTDAAAMEQNLVKQATLGGCPPYGKAPVQKAAAPKPAPKKAAQRPRSQPAARAQPEQTYGTAGAPRSGPTIMFGGGGIGIGF